MINIIYENSVLCGDIFILDPSPNKRLTARLRRIPPSRSIFLASPRRVTHRSREYMISRIYIYILVYVLYTVDKYMRYKQIRGVTTSTTRAHCKRSRLCVARVFLFLSDGTCVFLLRRPLFIHTHERKKERKKI